MVELETKRTKGARFRLITWLSVNTRLWSDTKVNSEAFSSLLAEFFPEEYHSNRGRRVKTLFDSDSDEPQSMMETNSEAEKSSDNKNVSL